ncbi:MAG: hypothetical protein DWQ18_03210 [Crenarchaeota archaeon]|nr:MAG: hypothetical protein DWQ17_05320 [Thermoproteota archaeon]RDJ34335.1 MAG: hypothetical protein DWQ18_03210 [Thermoproteota archaeon]RDJ37201.1 MAG: hypothetical protein DWQ13_07410 [Thermoproteota archaeon]RDJ37919.1 MAG: hypothetical protein DWQ19_03425 [Thermoproteota archaeon]
MKILVLLIVLFGFALQPAYSHKPIPSTDQNTTLENALFISDHKISWVIFETLNANQKKFYTFEAKSGESFYSSIVIPNLKQYENYKPNLALISATEIPDSDDIVKIIQNAGLVSKYEGPIPANEFYEPFGQATYWERQEINITIPQDGKYYLIVYDTQGMKGKYALAVGTIEDFSAVDFFTVLPMGWFETKYFFEDYLSLLIPIPIILFIPALYLVKKRIS